MIPGQCRKNGTWGGALCVVSLVFVAMCRGQSGDDIKRHVEQLGSSQFAIRQHAETELAAAGPKAVPQVAAAAIAGDAEIRHRASEVLLHQVQSSRPDVRTSVRAAIHELTHSLDPQLAARGQALLHRVNELSAGLAAAELARLGATIMPVPSSVPLRIKVQIRQTWKGGDDRLALLSELGDVPWLSMENAPVTDAALAHVAQLGANRAGPTELYLGNTRITGKGLEALAPLSRLRYLSLKQLPIDDAHLAKLPDFPDLMYLGLDGTQITDRGLKELARYPQLQVIWLDQTPITDAGLLHLKSLHHLRTLYLPGTSAAGPGLSALHELPNLNSLSLKGVKLSADSLKHIAQLEQLESLGLDQTNVSDSQLADLASLTRLRILWLSGTQIGDEGLEHLKSLKSLQIVHLTGSQATSAGAVELQRALPNCQVAIASRASSPSGELPVFTPPRPAAPPAP